MRRRDRILQVLRIAAVVCPLLLILNGALPAQVLCHRDGRRTVFEGDVGPGACGCEECAECLAARQAAASGTAAAAAWKTCHCRHEAVFSENGAFGGPWPAKKIKTHPSAAAAVSPRAPESAAAPGLRRPLLRTWPKPPPESGASRILRL